MKSESHALLELEMRWGSLLGWKSAAEGYRSFIEICYGTGNSPLEILFVRVS